MDRHKSNKFIIHISCNITTWQSIQLRTPLPQSVKLYLWCSIQLRTPLPTPNLWHCIQLRHNYPKSVPLYSTLDTTTPICDTLVNFGHHYPSPPWGTVFSHISFKPDPNSLSIPRHTIAWTINAKSQHHKPLVQVNKRCKHRWLYSRAQWLNMNRSHKLVSNR